MILQKMKSWFFFRLWGGCVGVSLLLLCNALHAVVVKSVEEVNIKLSCSDSYPGAGDACGENGIGQFYKNIDILTKKNPSILKEIDQILSDEKKASSPCSDDVKNSGKQPNKYESVVGKLLELGLYGEAEFPEYSASQKVENYVQVLKDGRRNCVYTGYRPSILKNCLPSVCQVLKAAGYFGDKADDFQVDYSLLQMLINGRMSTKFQNVEKVDSQALASVIGSCKNEWTAKKDGKYYVLFDDNLQTQLATLAFSIVTMQPITKQEYSQEDPAQLVDVKYNVFEFIDPKRKLGKVESIADDSLNNRWIEAKTSLESIKKFIAYYVQEGLGGWEALAQLDQTILNKDALVQKFTKNGAEVTGVAAPLLMSAFNVYTSEDVGEEVAKQIKGVFRLAVQTLLSNICFADDCCAACYEYRFMQFNQDATDMTGSGANALFNNKTMFSSEIVIQGLRNYINSGNKPLYPGHISSPETIRADVATEEPMCMSPQ